MFRCCLWSSPWLKMAGHSAWLWLPVSLGVTREISIVSVARAFGYCGFVSHHVYTMPFCVSCLWCEEKEEGDYSRDETQNNCPA